MAVAAVGVTATTVAVAPQVARLVTSNHIEAPTLPDFGSLSQRSIMVDAVGNIIGVFEAVNQIPIRYEQVPSGVIDAVLAVEDESFFEHKGINAKSLLRAVLANVSAGEVRQGGSTITQQLVGLNYLPATPSANDKIVEATYAVELEKKLTKQQILERYLNSVYFGNGSYGIQAAAEMYFNKNVDQLTMVEGAFLAGLIRAPSGYDPFRYPDRSKARREQALSRLVDTGKMTEVEAAAANEVPIPAAPQRQRNDGKASSYFADQVKEILLNKTTILGEDQQTRYNAFFRGGLKIYTTLNPALQVAAEQARLTQMPDTAGRFDSAIVSLDTKSGAVRAMVGGPGFNQLEVNLTTAPRQTGSAVKFMILAAAVESGCAGQRPHRRHGPVHPAEPSRSEGPLRDHRRRQRRRGHHRQPHRPLDQLHVRQARPRARPRPHHGRHAADGRQVQAARRCRRWPRVATRSRPSTWRRPSAPSPTSASTTSRTTSTASRGPTARWSTSASTTDGRCSIPTSRRRPPTS